MKKEQTYSVEIMKLVIKVLQEQNMNHLDIVYTLLISYSSSVIINFIKTVKQFIVITNNHDALNNIKSQQKNLYKFLIKEEKIKNYLLEKDINKEAFMKILENMMLLQFFYISNKMMEGFFSTNHPRLLSQQKKKEIIITEKLYYLFFFPKNNKKFKIPNNFVKNKQIFPISKLREKSINSTIINSIKKSEFFLRTNNLYLKKQQLSPGEFIIQEKKINNKNYQTIILCDKSIARKLNPTNITFLMIEIEVPLNIDSVDLNRIFNRLNKVSQSRIQITIEEIINENSIIKVNNYSQLQEIDISQFAGTEIISTITNFPKKKFKVIEKSQENNVRTYNIFIIFDVEENNFQDQISIKNQNKINEFIKNYVNDSGILIKNKLINN